MKNKKGFTLIELLAIIVILAIIAVITVPIILNIIENSRKGAATDSAYGFKDAVHTAYVEKLATYNDLKLNGTYTVKNDGSLEPSDENTDFGDNDVHSLPVTVSGTIPSSGSLTYSNNVLTEGWLVIGDYKVTFNSDGTVTTTKNTGAVSNESSNGGSGQGEDETSQGGESGGGSGDEEPSNPYLTRFDGNYVYMIDGTFSNSDLWEATLNESWYDYARKNTDTNKVEVCSVFSNGTVCLEPGDYEDNIIGVVDAEVSQELIRSMTTEEQSEGYCYIDNYYNMYDSNDVVIGCSKCPDDYSYDEDLGSCYSCPSGWYLETSDEKCYVEPGSSNLIITGYPKAKMEEAEAAGATCSIDGNQSLITCAEWDYEWNTLGYLYIYPTTVGAGPCETSGNSWDSCRDD